ncbi:hypothetical protein OBBRIDRAFT_812647 [Obba rivulosa]|uniref:Uncharacterized protein n=1 Tax=Obba rivulosa TaxID=1052685 RepID=A0A8E2AUJ5_9APHY|nr:hypothetical protein OBBRIDRAFT_812647 [Obba rivulosa]
MSPLLFVLETTSAMPLVARTALVAIALGSSGVSTALIAWCGGPYVTTLRWLPQEGASAGTPALELTTLTLALHLRITRVYDSAFLVPTSRPFATWELAEAFKLSPAEVEVGRRDKTLPREETVAETMDKDGGVVGRWIVRWDEEGTGTCREVGKINRYFNVHQELLDRPLR